MTSETKKMCRKKRRYYNRAKAGSTKHRDMYTQLQNATRDALRKDHWNYINGILQQGQQSGDNKRFWRYCRAQRQDTTGIAPLRSGGKLMADSTGKAEALGQ